MALILYLTLSDRGTRTPGWRGLRPGYYHRTTLLLAPGVAVYLLWTDPACCAGRGLAMLALAFCAAGALLTCRCATGVASLDSLMIDS